jgi:hypothetical protein
MLRTNSREFRFVGPVFRVIRKQPNLHVFANALVSGSICLGQKIEIHSAKAPLSDLVTGQGVCESERVFPGKGKRSVSRNGFVDEEQPDALPLLIQKGSTYCKLAAFAQAIRVCKMGGAGAGDPV